MRLCAPPGSAASRSSCRGRWIVEEPTQKWGWAARVCTCFSSKTRLSRLKNRRTWCCFLKPADQQYKDHMFCMSLIFAEPFFCVDFWSDRPVWVGIRKETKRKPSIVGTPILTNTQLGESTIFRCILCEGTLLPTEAACGSPGSVLQASSISGRRRDLVS